MSHADYVENEEGTEGREWGRRRREREEEGREGWLEGDRYKERENIWRQRE